MNGSLFLAPENPNTEFADQNGLIELLAEFQLIQKAGNDGFLCGENFAQLITFMGCSPHLVFEPPEDGSDKYCHIKLHLHDIPALITGQQTAPPRCPKCRYRVADWKTLLPEETSSNWHCPKCEQETSWNELDWRQSGGAGKLLIEIKNIFPGEAVPVDRLMNALQKLTGEKWRYFYCV